MSDTATENVFRCENCGREFIAANTDAERDEEYEKNYPGLKKGPKYVVCADCYKEVMKRYFQ